MLLINLESRMKNKTFWIALLGAIVLLAQQLGFDATIIIPKNYVDIVNTIFLILTILGVVVDTSTPGISDKVIQDSTVKAINQAAETKEEVKTEATTTSINNTVTENSQSGSADSEATSNDKESETNASDQASNNVQVSSTDEIVSQTVDVVALQAERDTLKAQLNAVQSLVTGNSSIAQV